MATQYTSILKLALPVQGELSGTWGDVVNDNITSMVEEAIAGRAVINTWTANSHTLTTADGTTSESRAAILTLTDTGTALTGAGTVICPAASKIYIVENGTGQTITVKTSSGTGIAVPNTKNMVVFCDGTNVEEGITNINSLTLNGDGATVSSIKDEDNMASNSATALATQQSIKAYVDSQVGTVDTLAEVLANGNTTGGTNIAFGDNDKAIFGAGSDLQIYHSGSHSVIEDSGTGNLFIKGTNLSLRDADGNDYITMVDGGSGGTVSLLHLGSTKLATTSTGIDVTGVITTDGMTTSADINFGDNDKAVFGAGSDLQIYSDGTASLIQESGPGALNIQGTHLNLRNAAGSSSYLTAVDGGAVTLFNSGSAKLATTSTGIDVTGTATMDGLDVQGNVIINNSYAYQIGGDSASTSVIGKMHNSSGVFTLASLDSRHMKLTTSNADRLKVDANGDISFYDSAGSSQSLFWDASAESLGIGTTSPSSSYAVDATAGYRSSAAIPNFTLVETDASGQTWQLNSTGAKLSFRDVSRAADRVVIDTAGNVGIGTDDPSADLHIEGSAPYLRTKNTSAPTDEKTWDYNAGTDGTFRFRATNDAGNDSNNWMVVDRSGVNINYIALSTGNQSEVMRLGTSEAVVNESSNDYDFRVESNGNTHALFVDAGNDRVDMAVPLRVGYNEITATANAGIGQFATATSGSEELWTDINTGVNGYSSMPSEISVMNTADNTANTFAGIFFQAGETSAGSGVSAARIGAIRTAALSADLAFATRAAGTGTMAEHMRLTNDGKLGIGTDSPATNLEIEAATPVLEIDSTTSANLATLQFTTAGTVDSKITHQASSGDMVIESGRNSTWGGKIYLKTDTFQNAVFTRTTSTFNENSADMDFRVESNGQANMLFIDAGNDAIGIGTNSITGLMELNKTSSGNTLQLLSLVNPVGAASTGVQLWMSGTNATSRGATIEAIAQSTANDHHMIFSTSADASAPAERMRLFDTGKVRLGNSSDHVMVDTTASNAAIQLIDNNQSNPPTIRGNGPNFTIENGGLEMMRVTGTTETVFNEGSENIDFRVESNDRSHMFFVDGGSNKAEFSGQVNIFNGANTGNVGGISITPSQTQTTFLNNSPGAYGDYGQTFKTMRATGGSAYIRNFDMTYGGSVFNEDGIDIDFRVETNDADNTFFVDGGTNNIGIQSGTSWSLTGGGSASSSSGVSIDMAYDGTIYAGSAYWAGGLKTGTGFFSDASGDRYKRSSRNATQISQSSQGGDIKFRSQTSGDAGAVISWHEMADFGRSEVVFNDGSADQDFRVESDNQSHMLFVDAGNDATFVNLTGPVNASNASLQVSATANPATLLNRTNEGDQITFHVNGGSAFGSIGVSGGNNLYISGQAVNHAGLTFATDSVLPTRQGTITSNITDLGQDGNGFKDLYLSGGVYLGGTASANKLDDYEEGTWVATAVNGCTGLSSSTTNNRYTKIGNVVHVIGEVGSFTGTDSGNLEIGGLPFAIGNGMESAFSVLYTNIDLDSGYTQAVGYAYPNASKFRIYEVGDNVAYNPIRGDQISSGSFIFQMTYHT